MNNKCIKNLHMFISIIVQCNGPSYVLYSVIFQRYAHLLSHFGINVSFFGKIVHRWDGKYYVLAFLY